MQDISHLTEIGNTADRSADQTDASALTRAAYATGLAQAAFGAAYAPPAHAEWRDRSPGELAIIRAARGLAT